MFRFAEISLCTKYRYTLTRKWSEKSLITFIGLNPSRADNQVDDPTVRRCIVFASEWGFGGFDMVNLFAFRSHSPIDLRSVSDPIGPDNDGYLKSYTEKNQDIVLMWGNGGGYKNRSGDFFVDIAVEKRKFYCFGLTKSGYPKHPLYIAKNTNLQEYKL